MYRIGIDLGGTNIAVGVVNDRYEIVARRSVPTGAERPAEEVIRDMGDAVEEALRQAGLTAVAAARDARSRHSSSGRPAAIQATK